MDVSIVIPAYNAASTIEEAIASIASQTSARWDVVIVNDGSRDDTEAVVARRIQGDPRFRLVSQANGGEAAARNAGVALARHEWLLFLDADDWIAPTYLERVMAEVERHPQLDAVHVGSARVATDGTLVVERYEPPTGDLFAVAARRAPFPVHACVVRKALVQRVGGFDASLRTCPDWDLWQRIARTGAQFGAVRSVEAFYRMAAQSASSDAEQLFRDGLRVLRQGHAADPRVPNPLPLHAAGRPAGEIDSQVFYLLTWAAGLQIAGGRDPRPLFDLVPGVRFPALHAESIAQVLHDAIHVARQSAPARWGRMWPDLRAPVIAFLDLLEANAGCTGLAAEALRHVQLKALDVSPEWVEVPEWMRARELAARDELQRSQRDRDAAREEGQRRQAEVRRLEEEVRQLREQRDATQEEVRRLSRDLAAARDEVRQVASERDAARDESSRHARERDEARAEARDAGEEVERLRAKHVALEQSLGEKEAEVARLTHAHEAAVASPEHRFGDLLLNGMHLRSPVLAAERAREAMRSRRVRARLASDRRTTDGASRPRIMAATCDTFPIYSQTFVHQELTQLVKAGFPLRHVYSRLDTQAHMRPEFSPLWDTKVHLKIDYQRHALDVAHYQRRMPERVEMLVARLAEASGLAPQDVLSHPNVRQAFTFARLVEAWQPGYLHSYFFYDRSLMALVAGQLLRIPRGVSCYADHLLQDYDLKVVPLHLEWCDVVVATSDRIRQELLALAPATDPAKILVKPNGIDTEVFPVVPRHDPEPGAPFRIVTVCRIEPKKGLLELVEAVKRLRDRGVMVEAHFVGGVDEWSQESRDYKARLDERISEHGLWGVVHLEGKQDIEGLRRFLAIASLFVAPFVETARGDKDGIPTALLEGMSTGLAVVATDAGSIREVVTDGIEGLIVPQYDPGALADGIAELLADPVRRARCGAASAATVRRTFSAPAREQALHARILEVVQRGAAHV